MNSGSRPPDCGLPIIEFAKQVPLRVLRLATSAAINDGTDARVMAREMIAERHKYSRRDMERWAFEISNGTDRYVATVQFLDASS